VTEALRVLITGGAGQLGCALTAMAPSSVRVDTPTLAELDICSGEQVERYIERAQPHLIINAAAFTAVDKAESQRDEAAKINIDGARNIAMGAAAKPDCRVIHISTDFVFDGTASSPYLPSSPTAPLSVYAATKRAGEIEVVNALPGRSLILRTAWLYSLVGQNFLLTMLRLMRERRLVRVVADQVGTPTSTPSLANVIWRFAERADVSGIYHWTDAGVASWYDFAVAIAEEGAARDLVPDDVEVLPITTEEYPTPARRPSYSVLDKRATVATLGVQQVHWRRSLRSVLDSAGKP